MWNLQKLWTLEILHTQANSGTGRTYLCAKYSCCKVTFLPTSWQQKKKERQISDLSILFSDWILPTMSFFYFCTHDYIDTNYVCKSFFKEFWGPELLWIGEREVWLYQLRSAMNAKWRERFHLPASALVYNRSRCEACYPSWSRTLVGQNSQSRTGFAPLPRGTPLLTL